MHELLERIFAGSSGCAALGAFQLANGNELGLRAVNGEAARSLSKTSAIAAELFAGAASQLEPVAISFGAQPAQPLDELVLLSDSWVQLFHYRGDQQDRIFAAACARSDNLGASLSILRAALTRLAVG